MGVVDEQFNTLNFGVWVQRPCMLSSHYNSLDKKFFSSYMSQLFIQVNKRVPAIYHQG